MGRLLLVLVLAQYTATVIAATRIACIGDSITAGACAQVTHGYPAVLQGLLGSAFAVGNFGNSGKTMLKDGLCGPPASGNCSYVGTPTWPAALSSSPDIVTIMLGTNDAKQFNWFGIQDNTSDSYVLDYLRMIKTLKALPTKPKVSPYFIIMMKGGKGGGSVMERPSKGPRMLMLLYR